MFVLNFLQMTICGQRQKPNEKKRIHSSCLRCSTTSYLMLRELAVAIFNKLFCFVPFLFFDDGRRGKNSKHKITSDSNFLDLNSRGTWMWRDLYMNVLSRCKCIGCSPILSYFCFFGFVLHKNYLWRNESFAICAMSHSVKCQTNAKPKRMDFNSICGLSSRWFRFTFEVVWNPSIFCYHCSGLCQTNPLIEFNCHSSRRFCFFLNIFFNSIMSN